MANNRFHDAQGPSQRQLRVAELIRRALAEMLQRGEIHDPELNRLLITVGEVRVSPDLRIATVFVVPLGGGNRSEMFDLLERNKSEIRRALSRNVTLKHSPELRFRLDETFDQMDETRRLLDNDAVKRDLDG